MFRISADNYASLGQLIGRNGNIAGQRNITGSLNGFQGLVFWEQVGECSKDNDNKECSQEDEYGILG